MAWARRASAGQRSPVSARRTPATYSSIGNSLITARPLPLRMISSGATYSRPLSRSERSLVSRKAAAARPSISTAVAVALARTTSTRHGTPGQRRHPTPSRVTSMSQPHATAVPPDADAPPVPRRGGGRSPPQALWLSASRPPPGGRGRHDSLLKGTAPHHPFAARGPLLDRRRGGERGEGPPAVVL